jgi:hypothetical protein
VQRRQRCQGDEGERRRHSGERARQAAASTPPSRTPIPSSTVSRSPPAAAAIAVYSLECRVYVRLRVWRLGFGG